MPEETKIVEKSDKDYIIELLQQGRAYSAGELSQYLLIHKNTVTAVLDDLLKEGKIRRLLPLNSFPKYQWKTELPVAAELSNKDFDAILLKSLAKIKYQSSKNLAQNTGLDGMRLSERLDELLFEKKVGYKQVGTVNVWFLIQNAPLGHLVNAGNHSYFVKDDKPQTVAKPTQIDHVRANLKNIERWASEGKTYREVAELLNIKWTSFQAYVGSTQYMDIKKAWQSGKSLQNHLNNVSVKTPKAPPENKKEGEFVPNKTVVEDFWKAQPSRPDKTTAVEIDQRFENTINHLQENGHSDFEPMKVALTQTAPEPLPPTIVEPTIKPTAEPTAELPVSDSVSTKVVQMSGGTLVFGFIGNVFGMTRADRDFLNDIIDKIQERER